VHALISLGTPVAVDERHYRYEFLQGCAKPKLFVSSDHDQYAPKAELEAVLAAVPGPKQVTFIPSRDHFFEGGLPAMRNAVERWVGGL
jgi:alpha/beta superfamily hydrolase